MAALLGFAGLVPAAASPVSPAKSVTVYTAPWCGACRMLEAGLQERKIPFQAINIEKNTDAFRHAQQVTGASAIPLTNVVYDGKEQWVIGVNLQAVERAYRGQ